MTNSSTIHNPEVGLVNGTPPPDIQAAETHAKIEEAKKANEENNNVPAGYTASTWAFQQSVDRANGINPETTITQPSNTSSHNTASSSNNNNNTSTNNNLTKYSMGNVPNNAIPTSAANANAEYIDPANGNVTYYKVPTLSNNVSNNSGVSITETPAATGTNQIPANIQAELQSGKISSWYNPSTRQTWYAPGTLGNVNRNTIWVEGPGYSGPLSTYYPTSSKSNGISYINAGGNVNLATTTQTTTIKDNGKTLYTGSSKEAPHIEFKNGKFSGLLNIPNLSSPAATFTEYQTIGSTSLPNSIQETPNIIATGKWSINTDGGFNFTPSTYTFDNGQSTIYLANPNAEELETYGLSPEEAEQLTNQFKGSIKLTVTPTTIKGKSGYAVNAVPTKNSLTVQNISMPLIGGTETGGYNISTHQMQQPLSIPVVYSSDGNGGGTAIGFQDPTLNGGVSKTYTTNVNGTSYTFYINKGQVNYAPTGSKALATAQFDQNPSEANAVALADAAAAQGEQEYTKSMKNYALASAYSNNHIASLADFNEPLKNMTPEEFLNNSTVTVLNQNSNNPIYEVKTTYNGKTYTQDIKSNINRNISRTTAALQQGWNDLNNNVITPVANTVSSIYNNDLVPATETASKYFNNYVITPAEALNTKVQNSYINPLETYANSEIVNPLNKAANSTITGLENFWNYYPVENGPGQPLAMPIPGVNSPQPGTYLFNTPVNPIKYDVSTTQEWTETNTPGLYQNMATGQYWNANSYNIPGFPAKNRLPPNVQTPSSLFNKYITQPINNAEQNFSNYMKAQAEQTNELNAQRQKAENTNLNNQLLTALENYYQAQANQNPTNIGNFSSTGGSNQNSLIAHGLAIPGFVNNLVAAPFHVASAISKDIGLGPLGELPYNPTGNLITNQIPNQIKNTNYLANQYILNPLATQVSSTLDMINPYVGRLTDNKINSVTPYVNMISHIPSDVLNYGFLQPSETLSQDIFNVGNPSTSNLNKAVSMAALGSSAIIPDKAALYGLSSGAINMGINALTGSHQTPDEAMRTGYQFGAATAPLFEGAQALGDVASKTIFPVDNPYIDIEQGIRDGFKVPVEDADGTIHYEPQFTHIDPTDDEMQAFLKEFNTANPDATDAELKAAKEAYIMEHNEAVSALWSYAEGLKGDPVEIAKGLAKLAIRTAPVSTLMGGITSGLAYEGGTRNVTQLATDFGLGYLGGEAMQTILPAFLDGIVRLKTMGIAANPDTVNMMLRGTPFIDEDGNLYYLIFGHDRNGDLVPMRLLLSTTQKIQSATDLEAQIDAAADTMKVDPEIIKSALANNYGNEMTPEEFYQTILDSQKGVYINHATPSDFPSAIADTGQTINPPPSADVGDTLRQLLSDYQGLYNAPPTRFGTPQVYNYLGVRPDLSENMEQLAGSNKVGIVTQYMDKNDFLPFRQFVDDMNANGADIDTDEVKSDTQDFINQAKAINSAKNLDPEDKAIALNNLKDEYSQVIDLYDNYNKYALLHGYNQIDSVRQALLGNGETELVTPVGYSLRPIFDTIAQKPMSYPILSIEPNTGVFAGTPFANLIPTIRTGTQTVATAIAPELTDAQTAALNDELNNYRYNGPVKSSEPITPEIEDEDNLEANEGTNGAVNPSEENINNNEPNLLNKVVSNLKSQFSNNLNDLESYLSPTDYEKDVDTGRIDANGNYVWRYDDLSPEEKELYDKQAEDLDKTNAMKNAQYGTHLSTTLTGKSYYEAQMNNDEELDVLDKKGQFENAVDQKSQDELNELNRQTTKQYINEEINDLTNIKNNLINENDGQNDNLIRAYQNEIDKLQTELVQTDTRAYQNEIEGLDLPNSPEQGTSPFASSSAIYKNVVDPVTDLLSDVLSEGGYTISPSASILKPLPTDELAMYSSPYSSPSISTGESISPSTSLSSTSPVSESLSPSTSASVSPSSTGYSSSSVSSSTSSSSDLSSPSESTSSSSVSSSPSSSVSSSTSSSSDLSSPSESQSSEPELAPSTSKKLLWLDGENPFFDKMAFETSQPVYEKPVYAASVSSLLFPSLNSVASSSYNPMLSGIALRPIPTAANPTVEAPLASPTTTAPRAITQTQSPAAYQRPLDPPGIGVETPTEIALSQAINENQAQLAQTNNPYNAELGTELQKVAQHNMQAREESNFQNALYLNSMYKALADSGLPESQIVAMLKNSYNQANNAAMNYATPTMATNPFVPVNSNNLKKNQNLLNPITQVITNEQNTELGALGLPMLPRNVTVPTPTITPITTNAALLNPLSTSTINPITINPTSTTQATQSPYALPNVSLTNINPAAFEERSPYVTLAQALAPNPVMASLLPGSTRQNKQGLLGPMPMRIPA